VGIILDSVRVFHPGLQLIRRTIAGGSDKQNFFDCKWQCISAGQWCPADF
jgi:hypothetical protein